MTRCVENNGIGALYGSFIIKQISGEYELSADDVGKAVALTENNEVGLGSAGGRVLGRLEHVVGGLAAVQIAGVARLPLNDQLSAPSINHAVVIDGAGKIYRAPAVDNDPAGGNVARGMVIAVDTVACHCDVLL